MKVFKSFALGAASCLSICLAMEADNETSGHSITLSHMPAEVISMILEQVPDEELLTLRKVCRQWNGLVLDKNQICKNTKGKPQLVSAENAERFKDLTEIIRQRIKNRDLRKVADAYFSLGEMYFYGLRKHPNYEEALYYYEKANKNGFSKAALRLAIMYQDGLGMAQKDLKKALLLYREHRYNSYVSAYFGLGLMYYDGKRVPQDYKKAFNCYQIAAARGSLMALNN